MAGRKGLFIVGLSCLAATAQAQDEGMRPAEPPASATPEDGPAAPTEGAEALSPPPAYEVPPPPGDAGGPTCLPACRTGYVCIQAQCVSACNPPCAAGEVCTDDAACTPAPATPRAGGSQELFGEGGEQPEAPIHAPGRHTHDGFMLRFTSGIGAGGGGFDAPPGEFSFSGATVNFSVDIGAALVAGLSVHARLGYQSIVGATVKLDDEKISDDDDPPSISSVLFGPGLTYYFEPVNIYLTGVIGLSSARGQDTFPDNGRTRTGWAANLDAGWEAWVSRDWALGVALRLWFSSVPDDLGDGDDTRFDVAMLGFAPLFSITWQ